MLTLLKLCYVRIQISHGQKPYEAPKGFQYSGRRLLDKIDIKDALRACLAPVFLRL